MSKSFSLYRKKSFLKIPKPDNFNDEDINILNNFSDNYNNLISFINNQNINGYMNFIVDQCLWQINILMIKNLGKKE